MWSRVHCLEPGPTSLHADSLLVPRCTSSRACRYWNVARQFGGQELWRELLGAMKGVADKHGVSVANVALRWVMQQVGAGWEHVLQCSERTCSSCWCTQPQAVDGVGYGQRGSALVMQQVGSSCFLL